METQLEVAPRIKTMRKNTMTEPTKTLEEWRALKMPVKHVEKMFTNAFVPTPSIDIYNDKSWLFESAKILNKWAQGEELTEEQFDKGVQKALGHVPQDETKGEV